MEGRKRERLRKKERKIPHVQASHDIFIKSFFSFSVHVFLQTVFLDKYVESYLSLKGETSSIILSWDISIYPTFAFSLLKEVQSTLKLPLLPFKKLCLLCSSYFSWLYPTVRNLIFLINQLIFFFFFPFNAPVISHSNDDSERNIYFVNRESQFSNHDNLYIS
jgi:hypothetical protein